MTTSQVADETQIHISATAELLPPVEEIRPGDPGGPPVPTGLPNDEPG